MTANGRIRINVPKIVHETIDGETVMLNLDNGNYYSLVGVGADIWGCIENDWPVTGIIEKLRCQYECDGVNIEAAVNEFISELLREGLTVPDTADAQGGAHWSCGQKETDITGKKQPFNAPVLNKYSDMQDLLLLDPIHEVDDKAGWPTNKPELKNS